MLIAAAGVIAVMVGIEQILDRQRGDGFHLRQDIGDVFGIFVVDQDQSFGGDAHGYVAGLMDEAVVGSAGVAAAGAAGEKGAADYVQAVFHFFGAHGRGLTFLCFVLGGNCWVRGGGGD